MRRGLLLLTAVAVLVVAGPAALAASCPYCGRSYPPAAPGDEARVNALRRRHEASCPARFRSGGGSRGWSGGGYRRSGGRSPAADAFGAMLRGFMQGLASEPRRPRGPSAAQLAAQRRRREERRRQLIRRAARLRRDWDRRENEMAARLEGALDVMPAAGEASPVELIAPYEGGPFVDASVVDLRPETGEAAGEGLPRILTGRLAPEFLAAQARRAAETDAFATANYWSVMPPEPKAKGGSLRQRAGDLVGLMKEDLITQGVKWLGLPGGEHARTIESAERGFVKDMAQLVSPGTARALATSEGLERYERFGEGTQVNLLRNLTGDKSMQQENYAKAFRKLLTGSSD